MPPRLDRPELSTVTRSAVAILTACVMALCACTPGADLPDIPPAYAGPYLLGPGDQIHMTTFGEASMTGTFTVDETGHVALPLLGSVPAQGETTTQLQDKIASALRDKKLYTNPSIAIEVAERRPVFVLGEVQKPGAFPYTPSLSVRSAVALAGGFTYRAYKARVEIVRQTAQGKAKGAADQDAPLQPGDEITVLERHF
jgi:polysaccharide export outer membrane protein